MLHVLGAWTGADDGLAFRVCPPSGKLHRGVPGSDYDTMASQVCCQRVWRRRGSLGQAARAAGRPDFESEVSSSPGQPETAAWQNARAVAMEGGGAPQPQLAAVAGGRARTWLHHPTSTTPSESLSMSPTSVPPCRIRKRTAPASRPLPTRAHAPTPLRPHPWPGQLAASGPHHWHPPAGPALMK